MSGQMNIYRKKEKDLQRSESQDQENRQLGTPSENPWLRVLVFNFRDPVAPLSDKTRSFWDINNSLSLERGSERGSEQSERVSELVSTAEGASKANEWAVRANEQTDERVAQYFLAALDHSELGRS